MAVSESLMSSESEIIESLKINDIGLESDIITMRKTFEE